jgi:hypothetical protein
MAAIFRIGKIFRSQESAAFDRGISRQRNVALPKFKVVTSELLTCP